MIKFGGGDQIWLKPEVGVPIFEPNLNRKGEGASTFVQHSETNNSSQYT